MGVDRQVWTLHHQALGHHLRRVANEVMEEEEEDTTEGMVEEVVAADMIEGMVEAETEGMVAVEVGVAVDMTAAMVVVVVDTVAAAATEGGTTEEVAVEEEAGTGKRTLSKARRGRTRWMLILPACSRTRTRVSTSMRTKTSPWRRVEESAHHPWKPSRRTSCQHPWR